MNYFFIVFVIMTIMFIIVGYNRGMVKEIISFVSILLLSATAILLTIGITNYTKGRIIHVMAIALIVTLLGIVQKVLSIFFTSAKFIANLPVVEWLDKTMGIVAGIAESVVILWMVYAFIMFMNLGIVSSVLMEYVRANVVLKWLYEYNYLAHYIEPICKLWIG